MNIRLGRMPWAIGWLFFASFVAAGPPAAGDVALLMRQLGADDFAVRESAAAQLASAGEAAIEPLVKSICCDGPEAAWRATAVLQQIAIGSELAPYGRVMAILRQENERHGQKLSALISDLNAKRSTHRRGIAHETIRSFGGRFGGDELATPVGAVKQTDVQPPDPPPDLPLEASDQKQPSTNEPVLIGDAYVSPLLSKEVMVATSRGESLTIDEHWRGGDEGLAPLCDLPELSQLNLSRAPLTDAALDTIARIPAIQSLEIEDMPFSAAAIAKFRTRQPRARVVARGVKLLEVNLER